MTNNNQTRVSDEELDQMIWKLERDGMTPKQLSLMRELREVRRARGADCKPELTAWYGAMPETNGKTNWTAILHRKGECLSTGITIDRSEYPDRVRYEADRMRHLIGELADEPDILAYDAEAHSGYVYPGNSPANPDGWIAVSERMPDDTVDADGGATCYLVFYAEGRQPNGGSNVQVSNVTYLRRWHEGMITHWMPLPAAPKEVG